MQTFRLLYFSESVLKNAEQVEVRDVLEAIEKASGKPPHLRVEVWSDDRRVAEIGTSLPTEAGLASSIKQRMKNKAARRVRRAEPPQVVLPRSA